jgi:hypothetical protein
VYRDHIHLCIFIQMIHPPPARWSRPVFGTPPYFAVLSTELPDLPGFIVPGSITGSTDLGTVRTGRPPITSGDIWLIIIASDELQSSV